MAVHPPFLGTSWHAEGLGTWGEEFPGRRVTLLRTLPPQPFESGIFSGAAVIPQLRTVSCSGGSCRLGGSCPSHLMVCVVLLFFSPSIFKKIFCQGEPLGHQLLALGLSPAALLGWKEAVEAWGWEKWGDAFPFWNPPGWFPGTLVIEAAPARVGTTCPGTVSTAWMKPTLGID